MTDKDTKAQKIRSLVKSIDAQVSHEPFSIAATVLTLVVADFLLRLPPDARAGGIDMFMDRLCEAIGEAGKQLR